MSKATPPIIIIIGGRAYYFNTAKEAMDFIATQSALSADGTSKS